MENIHPLTVHFPVALLMSALLVETLALLLRRPEWSRVSLWCLGLGALGAVVAVLTGRQAMATAKHSFEIHQIMLLHERIGYIVLAGYILVLGWRFLARGSRGRQWVGWGLLAALCGTMAYGAHLGGRLVYEFGVGGSYGRGSGIEVDTITTEEHQHE
jgi:uncharacterized membrane protein